MKVNKLIILSTTLFLVSCVSVPKIERQKFDKVPSIINNGSKINSKNNENLIFSHKGWWKIYKDPILNELMDFSLESNKNLKIASLNIEKATENIKLSRSQNSLYMDTNVDLQREKFSKNGMTPPPYGGSIYNIGQITLESSYTLDFFNKYASLTDQAKYNEKALILNSLWIELSISNQIVKLYGYYIYLIEETKNLEKREQILKKLEKMEKEKISTGIGIKESLISVQQELRSLENYKKTNDLNKKLVENNINLIAGMTNSEKIKKLLLQVTINPNSKIYDSIKIPNEISSDLIINRPDVSYYLMIINSQSSYLDYLKTDFYPQFRITGQAGLESVGFNNLLKSGSFFGIIGPSIYLPIFNQKKIKSNYKIAGTNLNIFIEQYNNAVLNAYADINNNLLKVKTAWKTIELDDYNLNSNKELLDRNKQRINIGKISDYEYTEARYKWLTHELQNKQSHYNLFSKQIDLINALGGTFDIQN